MNIFFFAFTLLLGTSLSKNQTEVALQNQKATTLEDRLVAYYPFNGSPNDESGNGHHGIVQGEGVFPALDRYNRSHHAYQFDGGYIDLGSSMRGKVDLTYGFWMKSLQAESGLSHHNDPGIIGIHGLIEGFALINAGGDLGWVDRFCGDHATPCSNPQYNHNSYITSFHIADGTWHYIAVSRRGGLLTFYASEGVSCDAIRVVGNTSIGSKPIGEQPQELGRSFYSSDAYHSSDPYAYTLEKYFRGSISDLIIFQRAVSKEEMPALCKLGALIPTSTPPPTVALIATSTESFFELPTNLWTTSTKISFTKSHGTLSGTDKKQKISLLTASIAGGISLICGGMSIYCIYKHKRKNRKPSPAMVELHPKSSSSTILRTHIWVEDTR